MAIISSIGRRQPKARLLIGSIYTLLTLGAITMLYPFGLMLAGTTKSAVDNKDQDLIPAFLINRDALYRKHVEGLFNESMEAMKMAYHVDAYSFESLAVPRTVNSGLVEQWLRFLEETELPYYTYGMGYVQTPVTRKTVPHITRRFKNQLKKRFGADVVALNRELGTEFVGWNSFYILPEDYLLRRNKPSKLPFAEAFRRFKETQLRDDRYYFSPEGFFKTLFLKTQYTQHIDRYNKSHGTDYASYDQIHLSRRLPHGPERVKQDWIDFVRNTVNLFWIRADAAAAPFYRNFLKAKYGDLTTLNQRYGSDHPSFEQIALMVGPPDEGLALSDWEAFITGWKDPDSGHMHDLPADMISIHSVDFMFRDYLAGKFAGIDGINDALGTNFAALLDILPPQRQANYQAFQSQTGFLRWEFVKRNYVAVIEYMVLHGRGMINTAIYCALAVLAALLVNPLAAYALSRYALPSAYKVLLFLMLTMAFPPMVTQIPVFLMLRKFHLLNTFWALILPGLANGYSIFLLKGFFDSQPRELYESAALDGAGEWVMFWQLTMSLSKPILAVIALQAFTTAYANFMYALLICQDEKMWTLMVWLYELQVEASQGVIYASLILAAIPTFIVFAFCQNIIMRGIVVPVEK